MIIDSHVHFWQFDPIRDNWITEDMATIRRDFLPADLKIVFEENNIDGCVAVQASQSPEENQFLLKLATENSLIKGVVGWIDLTDPDISQALEAFKKMPKLKSFRHVVQGEPQGFLLRNEILKGIKEVGKNGFTYDILIYAHQLPDAIQLSEKLPGQALVVDHCAKPALRTNDITKWKREMQELAINPDIYCKVSGLLTEDHWHQHNEKQLLTCLDVVFESFGTQRILFGSDWPVILVAGQYREWKQIIEKYTQQFKQHEREAIFGGNAARFYNL